MIPFTRHTGRVASLPRVNVDTDQIIPKQFLKRVERTGFGAFLFNDWRFRPDGTPDQHFVLNDPRYEGASILLAGRNFGCGSSREHAPWALADFGFRAIVAPSFADIFAANCVKNGLLTVALPNVDIALLASRARLGAGYRLTVDLESQEVSDDFGFKAAFAVGEFARRCLLLGLDEIGLTLEREGDIDRYESALPAFR
jgi:3-isopropylmalate/(R)-2-methylmalate dehydratase small subunit